MGYIVRILELVDHQLGSRPDGEASSQASEAGHHDCLIDKNFLVRKLRLAACQCEKL